MPNMRLDEAIALLKGRGQHTAESARFQRILVQSLAEGHPITIREMAEKTGYPMDTIEDAFRRMRAGGYEFNEQDELVGAALTQIPTRHHFYVNDQHLYAWCALDTLFLSAHIGQTAQVESICPVTDEIIRLTASPHGIVSATPSATVLSIVTDSHCTAGPQGSFCGRIHFFANPETAERRRASGDEDIAIFSLPMPTRSLMRSISSRCSNTARHQRNHKVHKRRGYLLLYPKTNTLIIGKSDQHRLF